MSLSHYTDAFERFAATLPAAERATRAGHLRAFTQFGFPHKKLEDWRYTDLTGLADKSFELASKASADLSRFTLSDTDQTSFINGLKQQSLPPLAGGGQVGGGAAQTPPPRPCARDTVPGTVGAGARAGATPPAPALRDTVSGSPPARGGGSVVAINAAFLSGGYWLSLAAGKIADKPIHVLTWCEGGTLLMAHLRHRIVLGANAQATVILQHGGKGEYLTTQVTEIELGAGSRLTLYRVQDESAQSHHLAQTDALLGRDSHLKIVSVDLGGGLARHDLNVVLAEAGANVHLHGLYAPTGKAHVDNHTRIEHRAPRCVSREFFRGVVGESAKAVFNGKIIVREGAIKTDSEQRVANLLLSPKAEVNAKPELEIYNDDVKCAHGATFGQLDEDAIFYLRARGVDKDAARALLTYSFAREVLTHIEHAELREHVTARLHEQIQSPPANE